MRTYPNGDPIPRSLPSAYQPASNADVPSGQNCGNCGYYDPVSDKCSKWNNAKVKASYWCKAWETNKGN